MPSRALTAVSVARIKPPAKDQVDYFDKGFPGLALRVSYGGRKTWTFFYRIGGKLRRISLGTYPALGLAEAREAWREARQDVALGRDPTRKPALPAQDFPAVLDEWFKRDQAKNRSRDAVRRMFAKDVLPVWSSHRNVGIQGAAIFWTSRTRLLTAVLPSRPAVSMLTYIAFSNGVWGEASSMPARRQICPSLGTRPSANGCSPIKS